MNVLMLQVVHREPSPDFGDMRVAVAPGNADERWVIWSGNPPFPTDGLGLPTVVQVGEMDGRRVYAERVPAGLQLSFDAPPPELWPLVMMGIFEALVSLHHEKRVHGHLSSDRVWIGVDGSVWILGRGRRGGTAVLDVVAAFALAETDQEETFPGEDAERGLHFWSARADEALRDRLARWVSERVASRVDLVEQSLFTPGTESTDEVVPDWGPDTGTDGLLDHWTGTTGITSEATPDAREDAAHARQTETLWREVEGWANAALQPLPTVAVARLAAIQAGEECELLFVPCPLPTAVLADGADTATIRRPDLFKPPQVIEISRGRGWRRGVEWLVAMLLGAATMWLFTKIFQ